jgi:hypothetical protein
VQHPVEFDIDAQALATDSTPADRFVYTPTFVVYDPFAEDELVLLPAAQLVAVAFFATLLPGEEVKSEWLKRYAGLKEQIEAIEDVRHRMDPTLAPEVRNQARNEAIQTAQRSLLRAAERLGYGEQTSASMGPELEEAANSVSYAAAILTPVQPDGETTEMPAPPPPLLSTVPPSEQLAALVESQLGLVFLDRTRIRPMGFALGEFVHSLSLAPGEEVTLEQNTYSKRETSIEQATEREQTFDTEMSSTFTTELNEGMTTDHSRGGTDTSTMGVNVGGNIDGITFNVGPTSSSSVTDADKTTTTESLKNSQVASSKVAARNRTLHKITFKVSTETRFETTSKRTIRNPNVNTPIDLAYFKVMQRLELSHERYGVRLCWAPAVPDPGGELWARLDRIRREIYDTAAAATAGPRPTPPAEASQAGAARIVTDTQDADHWDWAWGGQSYDYNVVLTAPLGYEWDGGAPTLSFTFSGRRPGGAFLDRFVSTGSGVKAVVHVGVEDCRNPAKSAYWEAQGTLGFTVSARFVPAPVPGADEAYNKAVAAWRDQVAAWEAADRQAKADAKAAADEQWAAYLKDALAKSDPMLETVGAVIRAMFPAQFRNDIWEIDFWEDLFDWRNAALRLYPSWWTSSELRNPDGQPADFVNASWARLYLPITPGAETAALRWIYERRISGPASSSAERLISKIVKELSNHRRANFGTDQELQVTSGTDCPSVSEKYVCLGRWEETLPTDGTHLEVLQATSSAADDYSREELADADALRHEQIERVKRENALRQKAETQGMGELSTEIDVNVGVEPSQ